MRLSAGWNSKALSLGGRIVLYYNQFCSPFQSIFQAPAGIISQLENFFEKFMWGSSEELSRIHWVAWEIIC